MEDSRNVAGWLGGQEMLTGRILTVDDVIALIETISIPELQAVARQLIAPEKARLAVVGPVTDTKQLRKMLKI
jgi:predicted Zn-dependent peptidase